MASILQEIHIAATPQQVWDAMRDVGAIHTRLARGFVTGTRLQGEVREVTFANGLVAHELIVDVDDEARRLVWAVIKGRPTHHNASLQVFADGAGSRVVWICDLKPDELAKPIGAMIAQGMAAMKQTLEADAAKS